MDAQKHNFFNLFSTYTLPWRHTVYDGQCHALKRTHSQADTHPCKALHMLLPPSWRLTHAVHKHTCTQNQSGTNKYLSCTYVHTVICCWPGTFLQPRPQHKALSLLSNKCSIGAGQRARVQAGGWSGPSHVDVICACVWLDSGSVDGLSSHASPSRVWAGAELQDLYLWFPGSYIANPECRDGSSSLWSTSHWTTTGCGS